ncbi:MAG: hypothetical protein VYE73_09600 [Acidobacteriota bacterium]|nr:hypothetical protein [Acidobacteriota bacterium]
MSGTDSLRTAKPRSDERVSYSGDEITASRLQHAVDIIEASFTRWPAIETGVPAVEHLRWKLEYPGWAPNELVMETAERVEVGVYLRVHRVFRIGRRSYRVRDWQDSCIHPNYQGLGLFSRQSWVNETLHDYDFSFWSSINPRIMARAPLESVDLGRDLRAFVKPIASSEELARRLVPAARSGLRKRVFWTAISAARALGAIKRPPAPTNERLQIQHSREVEEILDLFTACLNGIPQPSGLFQERSRDYLQWRYCDPRTGRTSVLAALENGEPRGMAVCKTSGDIGLLIELLADPCRLDVASELIAAANELLADRGVAAVVCRVPRDSPFLKVLGSHGYIRAPLQTGCLLSPDRIGAAELRDLLKGRTHHIMMGDFDWA